MAHRMQQQALSSQTQMLALHTAAGSADCPCASLQATCPTEHTSPQLGAVDGGGLSGSSETDDCEEAAVCWHHTTIIHHTDGLQELRPNKTTDPQLRSHSFDFCCADASCAAAGGLAQTHSASIEYFKLNKVCKLVV